MKIAIISDIHGNMEALTSVLDDIRREGCEKIFCLGDLAMAGPEPSKTVSFIKNMSLEMGENFVLIQGNTDEKLSKYSEDFYLKLSEMNKTMANAYLADLKELEESAKIFLGSLPEKESLDLFGVKILLVHGSPRRNDENIFPGLELIKIEEMLEGVEENLIFCGHTHTPCGYQTNTNQTVVNVGSVGRPFTEEPKSCYVVLNIDEHNSVYDLKHKFVAYDYKKASDILLKRGFAGADKLAKMLEKATSRYPD